jgi:CheY-like chemotaxis protein
MKPAHILFVDDEVLVAEVTRETLAAAGHQVEVCRDGVEAVTYYQEHWQEMDLVLLDMVMPRMGGRETFHALRRINPGAKILLVSGFSVEGETQELLRSGALGFLQKPYRSAELVRTVAKCLG